MLVQVSPQRWGPTSFLSHLPPVLLTSGLTWLLQLLSLHLHSSYCDKNNSSIWKWHITSIQIPLAEVSSMFMAKLRVVGTQKGRRMWSHFRTFMISNKGHHPSFISPVFILLWFSAHSSWSVLACRYGYGWGYKRGHGPGCKVWRKEERKEIRKYKNTKSKGKHAYNHNFAFIQFRYNGWWINL